ncbi:MAG: tRNA (adenosine(37)-N6)-threonylcarbamoyltransferase complex dimerization subunit type 1 TsaB [Alphaproteobacteria bacterium]
MNHPLTLALECTLGGLHMALAGGPLKEAVLHTDTTPRAADGLHTTLQALLTAHNLKLADVQRVVTTIGPGSFTGIRMGVAVGEALKLLNPAVQLIGLGTLEALAANLITYQPTNLAFTIATDAAGQTLYTQTFHPDGTPATEPTCVAAEDFHSDHPVYCPTTCLLLPAAHYLPPFSPTTLLAMAKNPATHKPFAPLYVKPLAYKVSA